VRGELLRFPAAAESLSPQEGRIAAESLLEISIPERPARAEELRLEHAEVLLAVCEILARRIETAPASVAEEADFFFRFLESPVRKIGEFDEREYYLGELALIAGGANRILFRREDARRWFDRAEANFVRVANASIHFARLAYQRLALATEERRFEEVLELAPVWYDNCRRLGLQEEALKCRFLEGLSHWERGEADAAVDTYRSILDESRVIGMGRLCAQAANNLAHFSSALGRVEEALRYSQIALPLLQEANNRVHLAKLRWSMGDLLRTQGKTKDAVETYRQALHECEEIGMRGDGAAIHLVLADTLLEAGHEAQAEWEVRAALPIIEEEKMVPEGFAALTLLRESLRRRKLDRQALRSLHGYFRE
jgi:tetratricopeptide (TPR) repeat protein